MKKDIIYGEEARQKLKAGVDKIANAVTTTLGPKGRNVALQMPWGRPKVVHDGVTVARDIELTDKWEDMGAQLVKAAAEKTNDVAGDGTTTSMLLAQALVTEGIKNVSAGANPMTLKRELETAVDKIIKYLDKSSKKITTKEEKQQIATISAQDPEIGMLIAEAMEQVGDDGVITVEEGRGFGVELEYKEGIHLDKGYASPYFVTRREKMEAIIDKPYILLIDENIDNVRELMTALDNIAKVTTNIVIIANDFDDNVLGTLVINKIQGKAKFLAVKAPHAGARRSDILEDIAITTGASVISENAGRKIEAITIDDLGQAETVISTKDETTIIGGAGKKELVKDRVKLIKKLIEESPTDFDREKLKERLSMMTNGIALISVGAPTEAEQVEKKLRVEDAVNATKAAVEEGIVAGGGVPLYGASKALKGSDLGHKIVKEALTYPIKKIIENAGLDAGEIVAGLNGNGFNVMTMKYEDMIESGIIDPTLVVRSALQNALSVATMVITTECLVNYAEDEDAKKAKTPKGPMP